MKAHIVRDTKCVMCAVDEHISTCAGEMVWGSGGKWSGVQGGNGLGCSGGGTEESS